MSPNPPLSSFLRRYAPLVLFLLLSYWLYGYRPIAAYPWGAVDDGLYLRHGQGLVNWIAGNDARWLGNYDYFLLSKAPLYGSFLGILNILAVPVRIGEFLLLCGLPFFFSRACRPLIVLQGWRFFVPAVLLVWLPILPSETHLLRNALQSILTSYFIVACIGLLLRTGAARRDQLRWAALLGLSFSLCYLNREEAAWMSVSLLFSVVLFGAMGWFFRNCSWKRAGVIAAAVGVSVAPLILLVCALNYRSYGVFLTTFRRSDAFVAAFQRMTSLEPEFQKPYIPIRRDTRLRAYELSPTFAKLKPILEDGGSYWVAGNDGHSHFNGYDPADKEFFVSNFEFALQFAAYHAGAQTPAEAERLFAQISEELTTAIKAGKINAGKHGPATLTPLHDGDMGKIARSWWVSLRSLMVLNKSDLDWSARSSGEQADLEKVSLFVHSSLTPEDSAGTRFKVTSAVIGTINRALRIAYSVTIPLLGLVVVLTLLKKMTACYQGLIIATVPALSLFLFCFTMAIVDILGFRFLDGMSYNVLGYSPFSVLSAFTFVVSLACARGLLPAKSQPPE